MLVYLNWQLLLIIFLVLLLFWISESWSMWIRTRIRCLGCFYFYCLNMKIMKEIWEGMADTRRHYISEKNHGESRSGVREYSRFIEVPAFPPSYDLAPSQPLTSPVIRLNLFLSLHVCQHGNFWKLKKGQNSNNKKIQYFRKLPRGFVRFWSRKAFHIWHGEPFQSSVNRLLIIDCHFPVLAICRVGDSPNATLLSRYQIYFGNSRI
jgi:hypothetical protein